MLSYNNVCSLALSAALAPPNLEEDCSPQWASFLLAAWTKASLSTSFIERPSSLTNRLLAFRPCYDPELSSPVSQQFPGDYCRMSQSSLCTFPSLFAKHQVTAKLQNPVRSVSFKYRCYPTMHTGPVIHCVASTTAQPHSLVKAPLSRQHTKTGTNVIHKTSSFCGF